jgi:hypothetical protein
MTTRVPHTNVPRVQYSLYSTNLRHRLQKYKDFSSDRNRKYLNIEYDFLGCGGGGVLGGSQDRLLRIENTRMLHVQVVITEATIMYAIISSRWRANVLYLTSAIWSFHPPWPSCIILNISTSSWTLTRSPDTNGEALYEGLSRTTVVAAWWRWIWTGAPETE